MTNADSTHRFAKVQAPLLAFAATAALFSIPDRAMAQAEHEQQQVVYADLDLATVDGQRALDARIRRAARTVCKADEPPTGSRVASSESQACFRDALRSARARFAEVLTAPRQGG